MLEAFAKSLYEGLGGAISAVLNVIFNDLNLTQAKFEEYIPGIKIIATVLNSAGWSMLVILLALCAYKSMISPDNKSEHPFYLACRAIFDWKGYMEVTYYETRL